jgi:hypothetical protein
MSLLVPVRESEFAILSAPIHCWSCSGAAWKDRECQGSSSTLRIMIRIGHRNDANLNVPSECPLKE